jgi:hypothetical protein
VSAAANVQKPADIHPVILSSLITMEAVHYMDWDGAHNTGRTFLEQKGWAIQLHRAMGMGFVRVWNKSGAVRRAMAVCTIPLSNVASWEVTGDTEGPMQPAG